MRDPTARQGTPVLGVVVGKPLDADAAEVIRVWSGSPAGQAGLKPGDRIVKIGKQEVESPAALRVAVLKYKPGDRVPLEVQRGGERVPMQVRLAGADGFSGWVRPGEMPESEPKGWLGVRLAPQASAVGRGVELQAVLPGSPADRAGLKAGDAIVRVDKTRMEAASDLQVAIAGRRPGDKVQLVIDREGTRMTIDVELDSFRRWHGDIATLTEDEVRMLAEDLLATPLALAEEFLPEGRPPLREQIQLPKTGVAQLAPTKGYEASGTIWLQQKEDGLSLKGRVRGLKPGLHGFHIHEYGDLRDPQAESAGGHFNPRGTRHGGPEDAEYHAGDLGNIRANEQGVAQVDIMAPWLKLHYVTGRSIVVHAGQDDLESQPSGAAGPRVAAGVIGVADPQEQMAKTRAGD